MAIPVKSAPSRSRPSGSASSESRLVRAFDAAFRFLASLKLAVISLTTLAGVLGYATFFNASYGSAAVQEVIYRSPWFALLLAFLGANILCAALIRYPWKKRQTGFVITHAGLLVVLIGAWLSVQLCEEGDLGMVEGEKSQQLLRSNRSAIRIQPVDPETGQPKDVKEYQLVFFPGPFSWRERLSDRRDLLTRPDDPFRVYVTDFLPASTPVRSAPEAGPKGVPMVQASLFFKPPRAQVEQDVFAGTDDGSGSARWLKARNPMIGRDTRDLGPLLLTFQYADRPEMIEDFLALPKDPLKEERIRVRYQDRAGQPRVFEWPATAPEGQDLTLPDSDIHLALTRPKNEELIKLLSEKANEESRELLRSFIQSVQEEDPGFLAIAVTPAPGKPAETYLIASNLPSVANILQPTTPPLIRVSYFKPPAIAAVAMEGRSGVVDLLGASDGKMYYRAFGRDGVRGTPGPIAIGKRTQLVGGPNQPVTFSLRVDEYLTSGIDREVSDEASLPPSQLDEGIPASRVEMTANGITRTFWLRREERVDNPMQPTFRVMDFGGEPFRVALDYVRDELPFSLKLTRHERKMDPGSDQVASYTSEVLLTDSQKNVDDKPCTITMNKPLTWRGYTFYQAKSIPLRDPHTGGESGRFASVFQVHYDPVWPVIYSGCLLVVAGTFVQFYMRAGVFRRPTQPGAKASVPAAASTQTPLQDADEVL